MNASTMSLAACLCYRALGHRAFGAPSGFWQLSHERGWPRHKRAQGLAEGRGWQIGRREDAGKSKKRGTSLGPIAHLKAANASRSHRPRGPLSASDWLVPSGLLAGLIFYRFYRFYQFFLSGSMTRPGSQLASKEGSRRTNTSSSDANHYCS